MNLPAERGRVDAEFRTGSRSISGAHRLAINSFPRPILPQAGPESQVIGPDHTHLRRILITKESSIDRPVRTGYVDRRRIGSSIHIPAILPGIFILLLAPSHHVAPVTCSRNARVGANID